MSGPSNPVSRADLFSKKTQGKTPWIDQSCADCPGFPVLGAGHAPPAELHLGASGCAPGLAFAFMTLRANLGSAAPNFPTTRAKTGRTAHVFAAQGGTRRFTQISGRNFLPELFGEVHPETAPFSKVCAVPFALHNRALFEVEKRTKRWREREEEGWPAKGGKRKKGRVKTG